MHDLLNRSGKPGRHNAIGVTVFGIVLALAPVMLWVAWSPFVFAIVVVVIAGSATLFIVLHDLHAPAADDRRVELEYRSHKALQDALIEEIHRAFPLTYHHSNRGRARYRRAMERLRELIG